MTAKLVLLAAAGALGTLARFFLSTFVASSAGSSFPFGTLVVNLAGCFVFGFVWCLAEERLAIRADARQVILTGFLGAFTTFSSFAFETGEMLRAAQWWMAGANLLVQNAGGIALFFAGLAAGRWV